MKPIIGVSVNFSTKDEIGTISGLGAAMQHWQLVADDYVKAVERAGGIPLLIPAYERFEAMSTVVSLLDGIIFTGGNDIDPKFYGESFSKLIGEISPRRDSHEMEFITHVIEKTEIPVLGICRGHQLINIALGGSLYQDMRFEGMEDHFYLNSPMNHPIHDIEVMKGSRLSAVSNGTNLRVNSYHHQCIKKLGKNLTVTASHKNIIEAVEHTGERFMMGLQWHPEAMIDTCEKQLNIFKEFIKSCRVGK